MSDELLLVAQVVVGAGIVGNIAFWSNYILRAHFKGLEDHKKHSDFLSANVLRKWSKIRLHQEEDLTVTFEPEDIRKRNYYRRVEQHLRHRSYREIWHLWSRFSKLVEQYNKLAFRIVKSIEKSLRKKLTEQYPEITEKNHQDFSSTDVIFMEEVLSLICLPYYHSITQDEPTYLEYAGDILESHYGLQICGTTVMLTSHLEYRDIKRLETLIKAVFEGAEIRSQVLVLHQQRVKAEEILERFRVEMTNICEYIELGGGLKGKCDACH
jgi:hypothetical protein